MTVLTELQGRLEVLHSMLEKRKVEVGGESEEADKEIGSYAGDRASIVSNIQPPLLSRYNKIRTRYNDAIVTVTNGHCTSCNVSLPPQMYIQVQKGLELISCPSCQRLLYFKIQ